MSANVTLKVNAHVTQFSGRAPSSLALQQENQWFKSQNPHRKHIHHVHRDYKEFNQ